MNLLYVIGSFYPAELGGPCNSVHAMAQGLARLGDKVTVLSLADGVDEQKQRDHGIRLNAPNTLDGITAWYFTSRAGRYACFKMYRQLFEELKDSDLVLLTSFFFPLTWIAALLCVLRGTPFALAPRGELEPGAYQYGAAKKNFVHRTFLRRLYDRARFVYVTADQEERFSRPYFRPDMPFTVLPNCLECKPENVSVRPAGEKRGVLYLGRLHPKKAVERLVDGYALLSEGLRGEHPLRIVGAGDASYVRMLEKRVQERGMEGHVRFLGALDGEDKDEVLSESKVLVMPSESENFGLVVLEALARGTPAIASIHTPWKVLEEYGCGLWIRNDPESLASGLRQILEVDEERYVRMSAQAVRLAQERFCLETNIRRFREEMPVLTGGPDGSGSV